MYIRLEVEPEKTEELEKYIKAKLPEIIKENIFSDKNRLKKLINECVQGQIRMMINNLIQ